MTTASGGVSRRTLPVVRWLQAGSVAAGIGIALVAAPAVAFADSGADSSPIGIGTAAARDAGPRDTVQRRGGPASNRPAAERGPRSAAPVASTTWAKPSRPARTEPAEEIEVVATEDSGIESPAGQAAVGASAHRSPARTLESRNSVARQDLPVTPQSAVNSSPDTRAKSVPALSRAVSDNYAPVVAVPAPQAKATAATTASAASGLGAFVSALRLNLEDLFTGTGAPKVTNPTAVVTGMFNQILRRDPTATELQNYTRNLNLFGVNAVVAGLYSSDAFRQNAVNNYYLELLGRTPTKQELTVGMLRLALGTGPGFAASIAGSKEFYNWSANGGGEFGTQPSATTYVDLLYRSLVGQATGPSATPLVQQVRGGLPIAWAASQFVNSDAYRTVKVGQVYNVLGQSASPTDIAGYVKNWFWSGGQAGITMSLLATTANVQRIEAGLVTLPNMAAVADLQRLLLAKYDDAADGFTKLFSQLLSVDPNNPINADNPCSLTNASCNQPLYRLVTQGGLDRGIPNSALTPKSINADVSTLLPTQSEIDLSSSLFFPLRNADQLRTTFEGGLIGPTGAVKNPIVTANGGTYIVDGHHRWSATYLINPYTQIVAVDIGYVPTPQTALKEAQIGVVAAKGYLKSTGVEGENIYTIDRAKFDTEVVKYISTGSDEAAVREVFGQYLMFKPDKTPLEEQNTIITNYLWDNVLRMRALNPRIPDAPPRSVMPQTDPSPIWQSYMGSGNLSYSFPIISYLG